MIKLIQTKEGTVAVLKNDTHLSRWVEEKGTLRTDWLLDIILPMVKPGDYVVDAGANIGDWTVPLCEAVGPTGKVYAFEPMPAAAACLYVNCREYDNAFLCNSALSNITEILKLTMDKNAGASFLSKGHGMGTLVSTIPLDLLKMIKLDWLKIDVEGSELNLLNGAYSTIKICQPKIICELNRGALARNGANYNDIIGFLKSLGYRMEFFDPKHTLELDQVDVFFLPQ